MTFGQIGPLKYVKQTFRDNLQHALPEFVPMGLPTVVSSSHVTFVTAHTTVFRVEEYILLEIFYFILYFV
jgi:hypothetical protein